MLFGKVIEAGTRIGTRTGGGTWTGAKPEMRACKARVSGLGGTKCLTTGFPWQMGDIVEKRKWKTKMKEEDLSNLANGLAELFDKSF